MPVCAGACGLEVARSGFTRAQLSKKDGRRCKQCLSTPHSPGTAIVPLCSIVTEPLEDLGAALRDLETRCATCTAPPPTGGQPWHCCSRCGVPSYCSRECQLTAWKRCEHHRSCGHQSLPMLAPFPDASGAPQLHTEPIGCGQGRESSGPLDILREWHAFAPIARQCLKQMLRPAGGGEAPEGCAPLLPDAPQLWRAPRVAAGAIGAIVRTMDCSRADGTLQQHALCALNRLASGCVVEHTQSSRPFCRGDTQSAKCMGMAAPAWMRPVRAAMLAHPAGTRLQELGAQLIATTRWARGSTSSCSTSSCPRPQPRR